MVDIPGLIEGAAEGAGLGIRFLKHLQRTRLMLHLIAVLPPDGSDIVSNVKTINGELKAFSDELAARDQWLVFNKIDVMPEDEWQALIKQTLKKLRWKGRRSEEHTSELQSLMRISYAVFCLKKKK